MLSPVIQKIRQECSNEFVEFERCLREHQGQPVSCSPHVARFLGCAETVDLSGVGTFFSVFFMETGCACWFFMHHNIKQILKTLMFAKIIIMLHKL